MTLSLTDLPTELLRHVLQFAAGDVATLLKAERACRTLRGVLQSDDMWEVVNGDGLEFQGVSTHRVRACVGRALQRIRWEQKNSEHSIIHRELGLRGWRTLIESALHLLSAFGEVGLRGNQFALRGDTCGVLAELVQKTIHQIFDRASTLSCTIAKQTGEYPVVSADIFRNSLVSSLDYRTCPRVRWHEYNMDYDLTMTDDLLRDRLIRRLSHRAGIVRLTNEVYTLAWETFMRTLIMLILPACHECIELNPRGNGKRVLSVSETIFGTPPYSTLVDPQQVLHTPVPRQIVDAAIGIGVCTKFYGTFWMADSSEEADALEEKAMEKYAFLDDEEEVADSETFMWVDEHVGASIALEVVEEEDDDISFPLDDDSYQDD